MRVVNETLTDKDNALTIRRLGGTFGAEITGVDLPGPIEPDTVQTLDEAFLEHYVSAIRNQRLTMKHQLNDLTDVLHRPVESAVESGRLQRGAADR